MNRRHHWAIRLRLRLLRPHPCRWNAWVRDITARLEGEPPCYFPDPVNARGWCTTHQRFHHEETQP